MRHSCLVVSHSGFSLVSQLSRWKIRLRMAVEIVSPPVMREARKDSSMSIADKQEILEYLVNRGFIDETDVPSLAELSSSEICQIYDNHVLPPAESGGPVADR